METVFIWWTKLPNQTFATLSSFVLMAMELMSQVMLMKGVRLVCDQHDWSKHCTLYVRDIFCQVMERTFTTVLPVENDTTFVVDGYT